MALQQIPLVGSVILADVLATYMAAAKLRLFAAGYVVNPNDTLANLVAAECTFSGYPAGGYSLATWSNGMLNPNGGSSTTSPQIDVFYVAPGSGSGVQNNVGGWFIVDAAGNLIADGNFDSPVPMSQNGDGFPISTALFEGTTNQLVMNWIYGQSQ
jgi:hypothetical protein